MNGKQMPESGQYMYWDILVGSLTPSYHIKTKWVRGIKARTLTEASRIAEQMHPNLGLTPTTTHMGWPVYPQPKKR